MKRFGISSSVRDGLPATVLSSVLGVVGLLLFLWLQSERERRRRTSRDSPVLSVLDTARAVGWIETFDASRTGSLTEIDSRWRKLAGNLVVDGRLGAAIGDHRGGWQLDGGDDYAFRALEVPTGSVEIVVDGWWNGDGALGALGAVQLQPPHQLYEAAIWRRRLVLIYGGGKSVYDFEVLKESPELGLESGTYRIVFRLMRVDDRWEMSAQLFDIARNYEVLAQISASDNRNGPGGQGIGILSGGRTTRVFAMAVKSLDDQNRSPSSATRQ